MSEPEKSRLPAWWTSGTGPLAIGVGSAVVIVCITALHYRTMPPDGFGTLAVISLIANVAAVDNCTDARGRRDPFLAGVAILAAVMAVVATAMAYGSVPGSGAGLAR